MNAYFYLAFVPVHVFFLMSLYNFWQINLLVVFLLWVLLSGYGVGVGLHRLLSHRSFETNKYIRNFLSIIACFCIQGSPLFWVAVHRGLHHKHSDTEKDVHSPCHGKLSAYFLWACKIDPYQISYRSVPDLLRSKLHMFLNKQYFQIIWGAWLISWLISPTFFYSLVCAQIITMHLEFCVNLFCHSQILPFGYRNYCTKDFSKNFWFFGLTCWGIGFHNNHHHAPNQISFAHKKWEFDPTVLLVNLIKKR